MRTRRTVTAIAMFACFAVAGGTTTGPASGTGELAVPALPESAPTSPLAPLDSAAAQPTAAGVRAVLDKVFEDPAVRGSVHASVSTAGSAELYTQAGDAAIAPASTNKVLTAVAVLTALTADQRVGTRVVRGVNPADLILVGGGDPMLRTSKRRLGDQPLASLTDLAKRTAKVIKNANPPITQPIQLSFDDSLFSGPTEAPSWARTYVSSGAVSRITALEVDGGYVAGSNPDPSKSAANSFRQLLATAGVQVNESVSRVTALSTAAEVAQVQSPPISALVQEMLEQSDNTAAEMLAHLAGKLVTGAGSFAGGVVAVRQVLDGLGVPTAGLDLDDGSGLSRDDKVPAVTLAKALAVAAANANPQLWAVSYGLPVAGFTGTLDDRFQRREQRVGRGVVRAKTGTLTGISSLAGLVVAADGALLSFAFLSTNPKSVGAAELVWDKAAAALAACGCR